MVTPFTDRRAGGFSLALLLLEDLLDWNILTTRGSECTIIEERFMSCTVMYIKIDIYCLLVYYIKGLVVNTM